jgi:hypothetical protein
VGSARSNEIVDCALAWSGRSWALWLVWTLFLGASLALLAISVLFGRVPLPEIARSWSASLIVATVVLIVMTWWMIYARLLEQHLSGPALRAALLPAVPLILGAVIPVLGIYASDAINHFFYYNAVYPNQARAVPLVAIVLLAVLLLQLAELERGRGLPYGAALTAAAERVQMPVLFLLLAMMGTLQSLAYLSVPGNDFLRYWAIADGISSGAGYPAARLGQFYFEGGMTQYVIDLPLYPMALAASFALFGHTVAAAYLPVIAANAILPVVTYLLFFEVTGRRVAAVSITALVLLFPPMRYYVLNWPLPDALFLAVLMAHCWLFVRIVTGYRGKAIWLLFGLLGAAVVLARPEGIAYAGVCIAAAVSIRAGWARRVLALAAFLLPVGLFSLVLLATFGTPWPRNWVGSMKVENLAGNWSMLSTTTLEFFASSMRLSVPLVVAGSMVLLVLSILGVWSLVRSEWRVAALAVPAWANLLLVAMVDPRVSGVFLWYDFFRHISYPLPLIMLAAWVAVELCMAWIGPPGARRGAEAALNVLLVLGVLWNIHFLTKPNLTFGPDAGNLIGADRVDYADLVRHPYELPPIQFEVVDGHRIPDMQSSGLASFPGPILEFYRPFDPVAGSTGVPYQAGSMYAYLAVVALLLLPLASPARAPHPGTPRTPGEGVRTAAVT